MSKRKLTIPTLPAGTRVYCGPFSLMAITGMDYPAAQRSLNRVSGNKDDAAIRGVYSSHLIKAIRDAGVHIVRKTFKNKRGDLCLHTSRKGRITLAHWIRNRSAEDKRSMFLIVLTGHFVVINGNKFIDTFTVTPVALDDCPHRRALVVQVYHIGK